MEKEEIVVRSEDDIDLTLEKLRFIWKHFPEMRLGQLLCSSANYGALYYSTDSQLIETLEQHYKVDASSVTLPMTTLSEDQQAAHEAEMQKMQELVDSLRALKKDSANKGRIYIHRGNQSKSIAAEDLQSYMNEGWLKGRAPRK